MSPLDKSLNPFEPSQIDLQDLRSIVWENQDATVLSSQIIVGALAMGVITFAGIALFQSGFEVNLELSLTMLIGIFVAVIAIMMSFVVPALIGGLGASQLTGSREPASDAIKKLAAAYQSQLILGCAFLEGAAFGNVYFYQMFKSIFPLVAFAICIALLLVRIPTKGKIQAWIASRLPTGS